MALVSAVGHLEPSRLAQSFLVMCLEKIKPKTIRCDTIQATVQPQKVTYMSKKGPNRPIVASVKRSRPGKHSYMVCLGGVQYCGLGEDNWCHCAPSKTLHSGPEVLKIGKNHPT
jgi:hypothetical protein